MMLQQQEQVHRLMMEQPQDLHIRETAPELKIRPYDENEDVVEFLTMFKRTMTLQNVNEQDWVLHLVPLISGKARATYNE